MPVSVEEKENSQELMFHEALQAIQAGENSRARDLLTRLLKDRQDHAEYWVWMSAVVETPKERIFCLKEALRHDPNNVTAQQGLVILGAVPPEKNLVLPVQFQKRNWQSALSDRSAGRTGNKSMLPKYQMALIGLAAVILIGLVAFAFLGAEKQQQTRRKRAIFIPTHTVSVIVNDTPTAAGPTLSREIASLADLLKETYTPTPIYVNTPHAMSEAYRIGLRSLAREDWKNANNYFRQAATDVARTEPESIDVLYYVAENLRLQGQFTDAIEIYAQVIRLSPSFAPAYLGRARARLAEKPTDLPDQVIADLKSAVENDPNYSEACLELAALQLQTGEAEAALVTLDASAGGLSTIPMAHLYRAQAQLILGDSAGALVSAQQANNMDITLLLAYRVMGEALQSTGDVENSLQPLITYTTYEKNDPLAWPLLANAYFSQGQHAEALKALNRALTLNDRLPQAYLMRAEIELKMGDAEKAHDDFEIAFRQDANSYEASLGIGRALMALDYPGDAWDRFERTRKLAETDLQKAELTYWRAQSLELLGELKAAMRDYQALVDLPAGNAKAEWVNYAQERILAITALTPTVKPKLATLTPTRTSTRQPSRTPTPTSKP